MLGQGGLLHGGLVSVPTVAVVTAVAAFTGIAITVQEQPDIGRFVFQSGVQGPNVRPPVTDVWITRQEQPFHPGPFVRAGVQGPNVRPPVTDRISISQQYPDLGRIFTQSGVQGPDVASGIGKILIVQEYPRLGTGTLDAGVYGSPPIIAQNVGKILIAQEQPRNAYVVTFAGVPPTTSLITPVPPVGKIFIGQEQPYHPGFFFRSLEKPNNSIPVQPGFVPVQENLTQDMLGRTNQSDLAWQTNKQFTLLTPDATKPVNWNQFGPDDFYADTAQVITSINYPHGEYYVVGWTPVGGIIPPIGNMYSLGVKK